MVTIVDYKTYQREDDGTEFHVLIVQGGLESVKSKETHRTYLTARTAKVACTFNKLTCETFIGTELPGRIQKIQVEPYEYLIPDTGEMVELDYRYEYIGEEESIIKDNVVDKEMVA